MWTKTYAYASHNSYHNLAICAKGPTVASHPEAWPEMNLFTLEMCNSPCTPTFSRRCPWWRWRWKWHWCWQWQWQWQSCSQELTDQWIVTVMTMTGYGRKFTKSKNERERSWRKLLCLEISCLPPPHIINTPPSSPPFAHERWESRRVVESCWYLHCTPWQLLLQISQPVSWVWKVLKVVTYLSSIQLNRQNNQQD